MKKMFFIVPLMVLVVNITMLHTEGGDPFGNVPDDTKKTINESSSDFSVCKVDPSKKIFVGIQDTIQMSKQCDDILRTKIFRLIEKQEKEGLSYNEEEALDMWIELYKGIKCHDLLGVREILAMIPELASLIEKSIKNN